MQFVRVSSIVLAVVGAVLPSEAQTQYTADGVPTGVEEEMRWRANRARFDTASENATRGTTYTDVPASSGPLAPNQAITAAARHQSEDLAKANLFQHETVPASLYYNALTQPEPWDRMTAEGYTWNYAGENIAAGYPSADAAHVGWWTSTGHRENMCEGSFREIGNGYYSWSASTYTRYYTTDLGNSGNNYFFTDTVFRDANTNSTYEQTEGVTGVAIRLRVGTADHSYYDISSSVGSFAIPIQTIANAATVQVLLSNTTSASVTLTIPQNYRTYSTVTLAAHENRLYGTFVRPATLRNFGFRDLAQSQVSVTASRLNLASSGTNMLLSWLSTSGLEYQAQWSTNFIVWSPLTNSFRPGTGTNMTQLDAPLQGRGTKFYRLLIRRP